MSTEHQQYSTRNQANRIRDYAAKREIEIVRTYEDSGKSGLSIANRKGLQRLIQDVQNGNFDFQIILIYDVSRWARFQDADEGAYYEFICRRAGLQIAYCAEAFENDGSPTAAILKALKRTMAAEYSRELSVKVFAGQCTMIERGFHQGGPAGYGLRRLRVDNHGAPKGILGFQEYKHLTTDHVVLVPGPKRELQVIKKIYRWFIDDRASPAEIQRRLNASNEPSSVGGQWSRRAVYEILTNEKYIGNSVFNRQSHKLKKLEVTNSPDMWVRKSGAFEAVVPPARFAAAQRIMRQRIRPRLSPRAQSRAHHRRP